MFDDVQLGWLAGDEYRRAAEEAEEAERDEADQDRQPPPAEPSARIGGLPAEVLTGRWTDDDPPGLGR